jgi:hypothetical protein
VRKRGDTTALGWRCPWSGDENDPIPWTYHVWFQLYRRSRVVRHWFGWHDWGTWGFAGQRCSWCGIYRVMIGGENL